LHLRREFCGFGDLGLRRAKTYPNGSISPFDRLSSPALWSIVFGRPNRNALGTLGLAPGAMWGGSSDEPSCASRRGAAPSARVGLVGLIATGTRNEQKQKQEETTRTRKQEREGRTQSFALFVGEEGHRTDVAALVARAAFEVRELEERWRRGASRAPREDRREGTRTTRTTKRAAKRVETQEEPKRLRRARTSVKA
jgi:hypothetical protein